MPAIERTAYPRFKFSLTRRELESLYTPLPDEIAFVQAATHGDPQRLTVMTLLKSFQSLGYFPAFEEVPQALITYLRRFLRTPENIHLDSIPPASLYRYHQAIRNFLNVRAYSQGGEAIAEEVITRSAHTMNDPADLISAAIEELVHQRFELPGFTTLARMAARIRQNVNQAYYDQVVARLTEAEKTVLAQLPTRRELETRTDFTRLKTPAKRAVLSQMVAQRRRLRWLESLLNTEQVLAGIPPARIKQFAEEARALEAGDLVRYTIPYQYTLLVCLLHQAKIRTRDSLATMFIKRLRIMHKHAQEALQTFREQQRQITEHLVEMMGQVVVHAKAFPDDTVFGQTIRKLLETEGGIDLLHDQVQALSAHHGNNILPFLPLYYHNFRSVLFDIVEVLEIRSTTQNQSLVEALAYLKQHRFRRTEYLTADIPIDFASSQWRSYIIHHNTEGEALYHRRYLDICIFSYVAAELQTGDLCVRGAEDYADTRDQLLPWEACEPLLEDYCRALGFAANAKGFVGQLRAWLSEIAQQVDEVFLASGQVYFKNGKPILRRVKAEPKPLSAELLRETLQARMPPQRLLDTLAIVERLTNFTRHFGPLSGSTPKLDDPISRYLMTVFAYGCNMGPTQTARHSRGQFSAKDLSRTNLQHITADKLDAAIRDVINYYTRFDLPRFWGSGKSAAADGTLINIYTNNLLSAYHIRYGAYGGIVYHHVADNYILLFSHFIAVGIWEAVYIIDGLIRNHSVIQPEMLHADTQGQSLTVFGFSHMLGIQLMPRIRHWKDLILYRPSSNIRYRHIDSLFGDVLNWKLIETHWQDLMQVILSIQAGHVLPSTLLRKLTNESKKNRLYRAFQELGRVVRTAFLLRYITDLPLRRQITATTNKVENYNEFTDWITFGGDKLIAHNDPIEMEKRIKYTDLVANILILKTVIDMTSQLHALHREAHPVNPATVARLSPYLTEHYQRFGEYSLALDNITIDPFPFEMPFAGQLDVEDSP